MPKLIDIPQYTLEGRDATDVPLDMLDEFVQRWTETHNWEMVPDFQRGHVWDEERQTAFVEHPPRGGQGSNLIRLNCPGWQRHLNGTLQTVDGLQRLTACIRFVRGEIPAFGHKIDEYEDPGQLAGYSLRIQVNDLTARADVLRWYLEINSGGIVHTEAELRRVQALLAEESSDDGRDEEISLLRICLNGG